MRILKDFKVPDFKFPKFKMKGLSDIEEMNVDYDELKKQQELKGKKNNKNYEATNYKTIKEIFDKATTEFAENTFILEKFVSKEPFKEIKYKEFRSDVISFGTALNDYLKIKDLVTLSDNIKYQVISKTVYKNELLLPSNRQEEFLHCLYYK